MLQKNLLDIINSTIAELGSVETFDRVPTLPEETKVLEGKSLVYVDDIKSYLAFFSPYFIAATGREVGLVEYIHQSAEGVVEEILKHNPDIVIIDYNLAPTFKGDVICEELRRRNFRGMVIGFSTVMAKSEFEDSGADGFVQKDTLNAIPIVSKIAEIVRR